MNSPQFNAPRWDRHAADAAIRALHALTSAPTDFYAQLRDEVTLDRNLLPPRGDVRLALTDADRAFLRACRISPA